jgi:signal transduction histidine kinase
VLKTLYGRLAAALLVLLGLVGLLYLALTLWSTRLYLQEANQRLHRDLARGLVSEGLIAEGGEVGQAALQAVFHTLMVVNPSIEVYLLDPEGRILAFSAPPGRVKMDRVSLEPVLRFLREPDRVPILGDDPRHPGERKVFSAAPVEAQGRPRGYLYVILAGEPYESALQVFRQSHRIRLGAGLAAAGLTLVFVAGLVFFAVLTRRLRRLTREVHAFRGAGPASARVPGAGDEVRDLEAAFREMRERIRKQVAALTAADEERRRLFTNVSHDLRTPLSSLQGHLETLLMKEGELPIQERRRFLEVAVGSARRLGRLIDELFELAKLEAPETRVEVEPFSLPELVNDVVQKLGIDLGAKDLRAVVRAQGSEPFVVADVGLVERLLENLLRNAVRHSPAGGEIEVTFGKSGPWVETRVIDQGPGIDPGDLPFLFERFFRARRQTHAGEAGGTGLGLSIARRIADLHGGAIRAENRAGGGAVFAFTLPASNEE